MRSKISSYVSSLTKSEAFALAMFFRPFPYSSSCALVPLLACVSACTPTIMNRGAILEPDSLTQINVGESNREDVLKLLGSPTQISTFDEKVWYYISRTTEQYAFLDPETIAQQEIEIRFDEEGVVIEIKELETEPDTNLSPVARKTPTYGRNTTFFEQLLGNIGRPGSLNKK